MAKVSDLHIAVMDSNGKQVGYRDADTGLVFYDSPFHVHYTKEVADKMVAEVDMELDITTLPLGTLADMLYNLKAERSVAQKVVDRLKARENEITEHIINTLPKSNATGVAGKYARVTVSVKDYPTITDKDALHKYIIANDAWDISTAAINAAAIKARWEVGEKVDGVGTYTKATVSCVKNK